VVSVVDLVEVDIVVDRWQPLKENTLNSNIKHTPMIPYFVFMLNLAATSIHNDKSRCLQPIRMPAANLITSEQEI
jgi:hypothetical protein